MMALLPLGFYFSVPLVHQRLRSYPLHLDGGHRPALIER